MNCSSWDVGPMHHVSWSTFYILHSGTDTYSSTCMWKCELYLLICMLQNPGELQKYGLILVQPWQIRNSWGAAEVCWANSKILLSSSSSDCSPIDIEWPAIMIHLGRPTTPKPVQYHLSRLTVSPTSNKHHPSSPPSSSLPPSSSPPPSPSRLTSSGHTFESTNPPLKAKCQIILLSKGLGGRFSPYRRPSTAEALELCFTVKSLRGGIGTNITHSYVEKVFIANCH